MILLASPVPGRHTMRHMKSIIAGLGILAIGIGLGAERLAAAATNTAASAAARESAVAPAARTGTAYQRYLLLKERVGQQRGQVDLVFLGDSITQGWEGAGKEVWQKYYGQRRALNLGIGGDRTQHVLWRLDNGHLEGIHPKAVVLMIGTNNSGDDRNTAEEMVAGVRAVVDKLRQMRPQARILLLGIFPRGAEFNAQRGKIAQVNQVLAQLDDGRAVTYLDIASRFLEPDGRISKEVMPDFLHLTARGYERWAEAIEPALARLLAESGAGSGR